MPVDAPSVRVSETGRIGVVAGNGLPNGRVAPQSSPDMAQNPCARQYIDATAILYGCRREMKAILENRQPNGVDLHGTVVSGSVGVGCSISNAAFFDRQDPYDGQNRHTETQGGLLDANRRNRGEGITRIGRNGDTHNERKKREYPDSRQKISEDYLLRRLLRLVRTQS